MTRTGLSKAIQSLIACSQGRWFSTDLRTHMCVDMEDAKATFTVPIANLCSWSHNKNKKCVHQFCSRQQCLHVTTTVVLHPTFGEQRAATYISWPQSARSKVRISERIKEQVCLFVAFGACLSMPLIKNLRQYNWNMFIKLSRAWHSLSYSIIKEAHHMNRPVWFSLSIRSLLRFNHRWQIPLAS